IRPLMNIILAANSADALPMRGEDRRILMLGTKRPPLEKAVYGLVGDALHRLTGTPKDCAGWLNWLFRNVVRFEDVEGEVMEFGARMRWGRFHGEDRAHSTWLKKDIVEAGRDSFIVWIDEEYSPEGDLINLRQAIEVWMNLGRPYRDEKQVGDLFDTAGYERRRLDFIVEGKRTQPRVWSIRNVASWRSKPSHEWIKAYEAYKTTDISVL
ncbi:MAG: hypothetical protein ACREXR_01270, partial [Gammaproteobacteria bacterium]